MLFSMKNGCKAPSWSRVKRYSQFARAAPFLRNVSKYHYNAVDAPFFVPNGRGAVGNRHAAAGARDQRGMIPSATVSPVCSTVSMGDFVLSPVSSAHKPQYLEYGLLMASSPQPVSVCAVG
jgi:hypothetical protein